VDISANVCSCPSFERGGVAWCKHLEATTRLHYGSEESIGGGTEDSDWEGGGDNVSNGTSSTEGPQSVAPSISTLRRSSTEGAGVGGDEADDFWWASVAPKLRLLATMSPSNPVDFDETIKIEFSQLLDRVILQALPKKIALPPKTIVPPNIKSVTETVSILPPGKKKSSRTDYGPYSMGEASGKKAKEGKQPSAPKPPAPSPTSNSVKSSVESPQSHYPGGYL
jgi:hypothetical protein